MGYCYGFNHTTGRHQLACDACGTIGGVRKRTCPRTVLGDSLRNADRDGTRHTLPWCQAPALCDTCWQTKGRTKGIHGNCTEGAATSQAKADAVEADLDAGHHFVVSATTAPDVPDGYTKVTFRGRDAQITAFVTDYDPHTRPRLADYPTATVIERDPERGCGTARRTPAETKALVSTLGSGTLITFDNPFTFTDGVTEATFVVDGDRLRRNSDYMPVKLGWKNSHKWIVTTEQQAA